MMQKAVKTDESNRRNGQVLGERRELGEAGTKDEVSIPDASYYPP